MAKKPSQTGRLLRSIFNPRVWMDFEQVKDSTNYLSGGISKVFTLKEKVHSSQSFDEAMKEQGVDEHQIASQKKSLLRMALLMTLLAFGVLIYALVHLSNMNLHAGAASFIIFLVVLAMAFRYHFWYYQLKSKRLGCSFREWFRCGLMGSKK